MRTILFFLLIFLGCNLNVSAQQDTPPEPDFPNVPVMWKKGNTELSSLQREQMGIKSKFTKGVYTLEGPASKTRVAANTTYTLLIKFSDLYMQGSDPLSYIKLYHAQVKKKERQIFGAQQNFMGNKVDFNDDSILPINLKKVSGNLFRIVADEPLAAGEYAIGIAGTFYSFGVDE